MLSKCANPGCTARFHYLREGRLFQVPLPQRGETGPTLVGRRPQRKVEHFWLCGRCAREFTLTVEKASGVVTVTRIPLVRRAAAS